MMRVKFLAPNQRARRLVAMLSFGGAFWLLSCANAQAQANPGQVNVYISRQLGESYSQMLIRGETFAKTATQEFLARNSSVTNVVVSVLAENQGEIAPMLSFQVSRQAWASFPEARRWATYFSSTQSLIGLSDVVVPANQAATPQTPVQPSLTTTPIPTPIPNAPGANTVPVAPGILQTPTPGITAPGSQQQPGTSPNTQPAPATGTQAPVPTDPRRLPTLNSPAVQPPPAVNTTPQIAPSGSTTTVPGQNP